jgi:hypothetical protein
MLVLILCFSSLAVFIAIGSCKLKPWDSSMYMINAEWLDCSEKFDFITRWGVK